MNVFHFLAAVFRLPAVWVALVVAERQPVLRFAVGYWESFSSFIPVAAVISITVSIVAVSAVLVLAVTVEAGQTFLLQQVYRFLGFGAMCLFQQALRFDAPFIQTDNFKGASSADSNQIGRDTLVGGVSYLVAENVGFKEIEYAVFGFQFDFFGRQAFCAST